MRTIASWIAIVAAFAFISCVTAFAQVTNQTAGGAANANQSMTLCPIPGVTDAQGNTIFGPCGSIYAPLVVQVIGQGPTTPTTQCPANPISRKVPPLC